ncbi:F0F1 ATP synthase subunit delta [Bacteroidales bacterium OttesenSCG-928-L03]|nr:F0F1 ATP synthase subunit delta [Bacteroidales bacterium OttesenSCG-928-L03]
MNSGKIATRYAKAIYNYAKEQGEDENLYDSMKMLILSYEDYPSLKRLMVNPTVSLEQKIEILQTSCGIKTNEVLKKIIRLIVMQGRAEYIESIALFYDIIYRKAKGMTVARLTTVNPISEETKDHLRDVVTRVMGQEVDFVTEISPEIIGGFILQVEDQRLDASVREQLNLLKLDLVKR